MNQALDFEKFKIWINVILLDQVAKWMDSSVVKRNPRSCEL